MQIFTCAVCGQTFLNAWSEDDALDVLKATCGYVPPEDRVAVCDACFCKMQAAGFIPQPMVS